MASHSHELHNLNDLREYISQILCQSNELQPGAFPMTEHVLVRSGRPCGMYFCLHGPRSVKLSAIWESERNTVLFYSATGERLHKTQLKRAPQLERVA